MQPSKGVTRTDATGRDDKTLTAQRRYPTTPAMAAGLADHVWSLTEIAGLLDQPQSN